MDFSLSDSVLSVKNSGVLLNAGNPKKDQIIKNVATIKQIFLSVRFFRRSQRIAPQKKAYINNSPRKVKETNVICLEFASRIIDFSLSDALYFSIRWVGVFLISIGNEYKQIKMTRTLAMMNSIRFIL